MLLDHSIAGVFPPGRGLRRTISPQPCIFLGANGIIEFLVRNAEAQDPYYTIDGCVEYKFQSGIWVSQVLGLVSRVSQP